MITFGINSSDLTSSAIVLAELLTVSFRMHDSSFYGGDYFLAETDEGEIYLQSNLDIDEPIEDTWPSDKLILIFSGLDDAAWEPFLERMGLLETLSAVRLG